MNNKNQLVNTLAAFKTSCESAMTQIESIKRSLDYTPDGKTKAVNDVIAGFAPVAQTAHDKAISIIDRALDTLSAKWRETSTGRLSDVGYQTGLANVIKMLEADAIQNKTDMQNIIDTYKDDYNALATISKLVENCKNAEEFSLLIPIDTRAETKRLLAQLRGNIDRYVNGQALQASNGSLSNIPMVIDGFITFVNDRFSDSLEIGVNTDGQSRPFNQ